MPAFVLYSSRWTVSSAYFPSALCNNHMFIKNILLTLFCPESNSSIFQGWYSTKKRRHKHQGERVCTQGSQLHRGITHSTKGILGWTCKLNSQISNITYKTKKKHTRKQIFRQKGQDGNLYFFQGKRIFFFLIICIQHPTAIHGKWIYKALLRADGTAFPSASREN